MATSPAQVRQVVGQIDQCIRQNGLPAWPDGTVDDQGKVSWPDDAPRVPDRAISACQRLYDRLPPASIGTPPPNPATMQALVAYARCARANGVPDWPDPNSAGNFVMPVSLRTVDPHVVKQSLVRISHACNQLVPNAAAHVHVVQAQPAS